ncbi:MAG: hypothetical protein LBJ46_00690 [Planctomycetota bacterium]|jgi:hypothetical protein|nr:hypothetical protein [Planctomycetota bacterium]
MEALITAVVVLAAFAFVVKRMFFPAPGKAGGCCCRDSSKKTCPFSAKNGSCDS